MADRDQRTESPTPQRIRKAREEGRFATSREMVFAVQFMAWAALLTSAQAWLPPALHSFARLLKDSTEPEVILESLASSRLRAASGWAAPGVAAVLAISALGLLTHLGITGFGFAPAKAAPDIGRLNPAGHLRELPRRGKDQLLAAVLLLPVLLGALWFVLEDRWDEFMRLPALPLRHAAGVLGGAFSALLWRAAAIFAAWGLFDLLRQRHRYFGDLRMTRQEVRDELRQSEGNPEIKARIRRMRRELLRRRMMAEVPKATAVIVNPTHYAVALRYDRHSMAAPRVVAKGRNFLAQKIRERALAHNVPIVENPPLARALYRTVEVGQEIPVELYRAVAEVLAYVYRLMGGAAGRGQQQT